MFSANRKIAVSLPPVANLTSYSGFFSPKIMESANRKRTIPPAIWNAESGISMAVRMTSPATTKNNKIAAETRVALTAILLLIRSSYWLVTAINTGTVPIGSITAKKKMNVAMKSIIEVSVRRLTNSGASRRPLKRYVCVNF